MGHSDTHRCRAAEYNKKQKEFWEKYQLCKAEKNGKDAKMYKAMAQNMAKLRDVESEKAAERIFNEKNWALPVDTIDLHGLSSKEAMTKLVERVNSVGGCHDLEVIVGKGDHSKNGPVIKPKVIDFATKKKIRHKIINKNDGRIQFFTRRR